MVEVAGDEAALLNGCCIQLGLGRGFIDFPRLSGLGTGWWKKTYKKKRDYGADPGHKSSPLQSLGIAPLGLQLIIKAHGPCEPFQGDQYNKSSLFYLNISSPSQGPLPACSLCKDVITRVVSGQRARRSG